MMMRDRYCKNCMDKFAVSEYSYETICPKCKALPNEEEQHERRELFKAVALVRMRGPDFTVNSVAKDAESILTAANKFAKGET